MLDGVGIGPGVKQEAGDVEAASGQSGVQRLVVERVGRAGADVGTVPDQEPRRVGVAEVGGEMQGGPPIMAVGLEAGRIRLEMRLQARDISQGSRFPQVDRSAAGDEGRGQVRLAVVEGRDQQAVSAWVATREERGLRVEESAHARRVTASYGFEKVVEIRQPG